MKNSTLVKMGAFLSKMKKDLIVKNLVDFVNKSIPEEYIDLLANCRCNVSLIGLFRIPDSGLSNRNTSYCCNVCNQNFIAKNNIVAIAINIYNY